MQCKKTLAVYLPKAIVNIYKREGMIKGIIYPIIAAVCLLGYPGNSVAQLSEDKKTFTVREGDTIKKIASDLGDEAYWESIYTENIDVILADSTLSEGLVLTLPAYVTDMLNESEELNASPTSDEDKLLQQFRDAFNNATAQDSTATAQQNQLDPILEFEGMVLDETRSKMGRDFYDLFYQNWRSPTDASNLTINITEQPALGRGAIITVVIDDTPVYSARLQPRYEYIEAVTQQAIAQCQNYIAQQATVREQLTGY